MAKYTSINHNGKLLEIKFSKNFNNQLYFEKPVRIILRWKNSQDDISWAMHQPSPIFESIIEIIDFLLKNQDSPYLKVKVYKDKEIK